MKFFLEFKIVFLFIVFIFNDECLNYKTYKELELEDYVILIIII